MSWWKKVKKTASSVGSGIKKAADKAVDTLDKVTDNKVFEIGANAMGTVYGVPNLGTMARKGVNASQELMDGNYMNALQLAMSSNPGLSSSIPSVQGFDVNSYVSKFNEAQKLGNSLYIPKQLMKNGNMNSLAIHEYLGQNLLNNNMMGAYKVKALSPFLNQISDRQVYDLFNF